MTICPGGTMQARNIVTCLGVLTACFAISSPVVAEDSCSGYDIYVGGVHVITESDPELAIAPRDWPMRVDREDES